jgi:hypothetical protein
MFGCHKVVAACTQSGTLSYLEGPQSDHRGLFVDIDAIKLLQYNAHDNSIQPPQLRLLRSRHPELVATYIDTMLQYYEDHNMVQRITNLHKTHQTMNDNEVRQILEAWDRDQGRAMHHSESRCGRRSQRNHWSPTLRNAGVLCRYWSLRFKEASTAGDYSRTITRLLHSAQQYDKLYTFPQLETSMTLPEIIKQWKLAKKHFARHRKTLKRTASSRIMTF